MTRSPGGWSVGRRAALLVGWGGALYAAANLHHLSGDLGHSICGPWGCGPPTEALLGYHGFWLLLILPPALAACWKMPGRWAVRCAGAAVAVGLLAIVGVTGWEAYRWGIVGSEFQKQYVVQRCVFAVVNLVDVPILQLTLTGLLCWALVALLNRRRASGAGPQATAVAGSREAGEVGGDGGTAVA